MRLVLRQLALPQLHGSGEAQRNADVTIQLLSCSLYQLIMASAGSDPCENKLHHGIYTRRMDHAQVSTFRPQRPPPLAQFRAPPVASNDLWYKPRRGIPFEASTLEFAKAVVPLRSMSWRLCGKRSSGTGLDHPSLSPPTIPRQRFDFRQ